MAPEAEPQFTPGSRDSQAKRNFILQQGLGEPAHAACRFAQVLAGSFALAIGICLGFGWRTPAVVLEAFLIVAIGALALGGLCVGSFVFHLLHGRLAFAIRTLPWASDF